MAALNMLPDDPHRFHFEKFEIKPYIAKPNSTMDIAKDLKELLAKLIYEEDLMLDGEPISDEALDILRLTVKFALETSSVIQAKTKTGMP